jgi:RNA polymerase sigma factor (sigma-70 family)
MLLSVSTHPVTTDEGKGEGASLDGLSGWVLATSPHAVAFATSLLRDREQAEDVVQDCYCRLLGKAAVYDLPRDGLKLLLKSVSNACINLKSRRRFVISLSGHPDRAQARPLEVVDRSAEKPADRLMSQELRQAIGRGLELLPVRQRAALELKSLGHSQQEIGEILETSSNHAGVLIHRARQAMETHLASFVGRPDP